MRLFTKMSVLNRIFEKKLLTQLFKYGINCTLSLVVKLTFAELFFLFMTEQVAYAVVQVPVFLFSYFIHSKNTFKTTMSFGGAIKYLRVVIVFQALDYLVFSIAFSQLSIQSHLSILIATVAIFMIRFVWVRRVLLKAA